MRGKKAKSFNGILRLVTRPIPFSEPGASQGFGVSVPENEAPMRPSDVGPGLLSRGTPSGPSQPSDRPGTPRSSGPKHPDQAVHPLGPVGPHGPCQSPPRHRRVVAHPDKELTEVLAPEQAQEGPRGVFPALHDVLFVPDRRCTARSGPPAGCGQPHACRRT